MSFSLYTNISLHSSSSSSRFPTLHDHHRRRHFTFKIPTFRRNSSILRATISADNHLLASLRAAATTSTLLLLGLTLRVSPAASTPLPLASVVEEEEETVTQADVEVVDRESKNDIVRSEEEKQKQNDEFEAWKSKTYALSVPLKVVALRGSIPPSWVKDFTQSQGKRVRFQLQYLGSIENIFSDLSMSLSKSKIGPKSTMAADLVTTGDSWLSHAIKKGIIEPIKGAEEQDWFKTLSDKWKTYLRRNHEGEVDPKGEVWAVPYRWGSLVIAYKKSKFRKYNLAPIEDWSDLWRPELAGRISMVDSPREVIGAVLKFMGASYNTENIELEVPGGRNAVQQNLALLAKQVRLFDSTNYLKAFNVGDVWVSVGWSSDVLPMAKRMSNVAVVIPKSGTSLWTDLWVIPAASKISSNKIGGRIRGPSPLIHQWLEFCLQAARALPLKQEVIPGASPSAIESIPSKVPEELTKGKPKLDTNLIAGVPPPEIMSKCEFLEPLSDAALTDYNLLISSLKDNAPGLVQTIRKLMK